MKPDELKGFFSPIRAAYGIPENVPIIEELDRRFERMEATIKELENKNIALEIFAKGATTIGGDQIERIQELECTLAEREAWFEKCIAMWKQEEVMWKEREAEMLAALGMKWAGTKPE